MSAVTLEARYLAWVRVNDSDAVLVIVKLIGLRIEAAAHQFLPALHRLALRLTGARVSQGVQSFIGQINQQRSVGLGQIVSYIVFRIDRIKNLDGPRVLLRQLGRRIKIRE